MTQVNIDIQPVAVVVQEQPTRHIAIIAQGPQGPLTSDVTEIQDRLSALEAGIDNGIY